MVRKMNGGSMDLYDLCATRMSAEEFRRQLESHDPKEWNKVWKVNNDAYCAFHVACIAQTDIDVFKAIFDHAQDNGHLWLHRSKMLEQTPLHFLCEQRVAKNNISASTMEYLLKTAGASKCWTMRDGEGWTALHYALDFGYAERTQITKAMLEVCIANGGSTALFIREPQYGYAPIWGVLAKQNVEWLKIVMKLGGTEELMQHKDPMPIIEQAFRHFIAKPDMKREMVQYIQKELAAYYLKKVSDLPYTKEYLDNVGVSLQDLPKHVIEDKIIPKIGGRGLSPASNYGARARSGTRIGKNLK